MQYQYIDALTTVFRANFHSIAIDEESWHLELWRRVQIVHLDWLDGRLESSPAQFHDLHGGLQTHEKFHHIWPNNFRIQGGPFVWPKFPKRLFTSHKTNDFHGSGRGAKAHIMFLLGIADWKDRSNPDDLLESERRPSRHLKEAETLHRRLKEVEESV